MHIIIQDPMSESGDIQKCLFLLNCLTVSPSNVSTKELRHDLLGALLKSFEDLVSKDASWAEVLADVGHDGAVDLSASPPSTSSDQPPQNDPRARFGHYLSAIYERLSATLESQRGDGVDEYTLLSLKDIALISGSLQFFVLTNILPYLDEGVGLPVQKRSTIIKTWKKLTDDVHYQRKQLSAALCVIRLLLNSNDALKTEIIKRYVADIVCVFEQLAYLGLTKDDAMSSVEQLLQELPRPFLATTLLSLSKPSDPRTPPPSWFTISIGRRLSDMLCSPGGLNTMLQSYTEIGGDQFWHNSLLITSLGRQLALPPKDKKRMAYYENITHQFEKVLQVNTHPSDSVARLFSVFVDSMASKDSLAANILVLDAVFKPWESLALGEEVSRPLDASHSRSLSLLKLWVNERLCPTVLSESPRLLEIVPTFLGLLTTSEMEHATTTGVRSLLDTITAVLKMALAKVTNPSDLLLSFISSPRSRCYQLVSKKKLISVVGEEETDSPIMLSLLQESDREVAVMSRIEAVICLIKSLDARTASTVLLGMLCSAVSQWSNAVEKSEEGPRFVSLGNSEHDPEWSRISSHLVAVVCFEQLGEMDIDSTDSSVTMPIISLVQNVIRSVTEWCGKESSLSLALDVRKAPSHDAVEEAKLRVTSAKMAVGLVAAVIGAATVSDEVGDSLKSMASELSDFSALISSRPEAEWQDIASQTNEVLGLLKLVGLVDANASGASGGQKHATNSTSSHRLPSDFIADLRRDLSDPLEPIRGEALLRTSRAVRKRDKRVLTALDEWLYDAVKDLVSDADSYVYLAAINALAEIACYDSRKYLTDLLDMFRRLSTETKEQELPSVTPQSASSSKTETAEKEHGDDSVLMLRGMLAEAIGKVFRYLGDVAPAWLTQAASVFLHCLREDNDIIRASCLSAFSDLILSCRGRGIEKYMDELLFAVEQLLRSDKNPLVRRAAVHLIRQCLQSCDAAIIEVMGGRLRDLRRALSWLWKWDADHVVRLHAELCLQEMKHCLEGAIVADTSAMMRIIRI